MTDSSKSKLEGKKILIVDDDPELGKILSDRLVHGSHLPVVAETAKVAQQLISEKKFDLVISDIRMPGMSGIQLLHWIRTHCPSPVILISGFSDITGKSEANDLGAMAYLTKPFSYDELIKTIQSCFPQDPGTNPFSEDPDSSFFNIQIKDFIQNQKLQHDIYVRISENKYLKAYQSGDEFNLNLLSASSRLISNTFYVRKSDLQKYKEFNLIFANKIKQSITSNRYTKINFIKKTSDMVLQKLYTTNVPFDSFSQAKNLVISTINLLSESTYTLELLCNLANKSDFLYMHSISVSLYSVLIGIHSGWKSPPVLFNLSLGGLMHDVGKTTLPQELLDKHEQDMTPEEVIIYKTHSQKGFELLSEIKEIPRQVLQLVLEHHENCLGTGYPSKFKKTEISPLSRTMAVANEFCNLVIKNSNDRELSYREAILEMTSDENLEVFDEEALTGLSKLFGMSYSKRKKSA